MLPLEIWKTSEVPNFIARRMELYPAAQEPHLMRATMASTRVMSCSAKGGGEVTLWQ